MTTFLPHYQPSICYSQTNSRSRLKGSLKSKKSPETVVSGA
ncbi:hypothetical protein GCWU000324_03005 [Kingella oralis ATCC 51147]|uniref:Uncharacterized protein n=1 Tax=Kingella oralis ATCC 51147 TaxID=629741 RepID=C4GMR9_9NEIS|nr:hypothetical protein GCWU000324_03005 [Kingella oralis ATCC 51147]